MGIEVGGRVGCVVEFFLSLVLLRGLLLVREGRWGGSVVWGTDAEALAIRVCNLVRGRGDLCAMEGDTEFESGLDVVSFLAERASRPLPRVSIRSLGHTLAPAKG